MAVFVVKIVQMLAAASVLVLAFAAPRFMMTSVAVFGATAAIIAAAVLWEGVPRARLIARSGPVGRDEQPIKFWGLVTVNVLVIAIGLALTQLWRL